jgi:glycerol transport system permease protein
VTPPATTAGVLRDAPAVAGAPPVRAEAVARPKVVANDTVRGRTVVMTLYLLFLALPIYWLVNMSLKTNMEITSGLTLWPREITFDNYIRIFTDPSWYSGYINSLTYVVINTVLSISFALPAAYAFSRYRFLGDKHLFFWLLTNRMAPPAVFALPFFNLYSAIGLFDTPWAVALAHCLFNVPLACGFSKASCPGCRGRSTRPPPSTAIPSRASSSRSSCR